MAKILVVDDEIDVCSELAEILEEYKHKVDYSESARGALQKIQKESYDVIFLDMLMPKMEGHEALSEIKKLTQAPVVVMSGYLAADIELEAKRAGAHTCIKKPFKIKDIQSIISNIEKNTAREANS